MRIPEHYDPDHDLMLDDEPFRPSNLDLVGVIACLASALVVIGFMLWLAVSSALTVEARETLRSQEITLGSSFRSIADARAEVQL